MSRKIMLFSSLLYLLFSGCADDDCLGFRSEPYLWLCRAQSSSLNLDSVYAFGTDNKKIRGDQIVSGDCEPEAMFRIPMPINTEEFTLYMMSNGNLDSLVLNYRMKSEYKGNACGYRFYLTDLGIKQCSLTAKDFRMKECTGYNVLFNGYNVYEFYRVTLE